MNKKLLSMATGVLTLLGISTATANATPVTHEHVSSISNVTSNTPVVLECPSFSLSDDSSLIVAGHYSHQSHYSHSSHVSHQSHYSSRY